MAYFDKMNVATAQKVINYFKNVEPTCEECPFESCCSAMRCDLEDAERMARHYNSKIKELEDMFNIIEDLPNEPLDEAEKNYLIALLKPFKRFEKNIRVMKVATNDDKSEYLCVWRDGLDCVFPPFKRGKKYKGLESGVTYTLEDLGIRL